MSLTMVSTIVIKVKYAETLRRFNARIVDGELDLNMDGLREKILGLFKFSPDAELTMTYVDEDNDMVTIVDDEDLRDVVRQGLNPLRITVNLSTERSGKSSSRTSGTSTPLRSPRVQQPLQNFNTEILNSIPEPLRRIFTKFATEILTSSRSSSATSLQHFVEMFMNQHSNYESGPNATTHGGAPGGATNGTVSQDTEGSQIKGAAADVLSSDRSEVVFTNAKFEPTLKNDKVKSQSDSGGSKGSATAVPGLEDLRAALESVTESTSVDPKPPSTSQTNVGKKKLIKLSSSAAPPVSKNELTAAVKSVKLSSLGAPPVSKSVPANKKEASEKFITTTTPKPITIDDFPSPFTTTWSNLNSQPTDASGGIRNVLGSDPQNSSTSNPIPSPMSDCPFMGMPLGNSLALPSQTPPFVLQSRRKQGQGDGSGMIFHGGVRCDGCGVHPITGPRFKSKVKDDYDLCTFCFGQMGNENDYIRMDRPMIYRHPFSFKGLHEHPTRGHPAHPQVFRGCRVKPIKSKLDSRFIQDMNVLDGTLMAPLTPFTKIWQMRNNGTVVWPQGTQLVWIGGDKLTDAFSAELEIPDAGLPVDKELEVAVDFVAPKHPGRYISHWRMASPSGQKFGQRVWVLIQVEASSKELPPSFHGFNLNLPPVPSGIANPEIINVNPEPAVEDGLSELGLTEFASSNRTTDLVEPIVDLPQKEQEVNFPINDSLLVGGTASRPDPIAPSSSSVFYPIIDLSEVAPAPLSAPPPVTVVQTSPQDVGQKNEVEETLLKDLEEMGFKQVDLNKEILRLNEYDLEKSVDDLCGVSEWDPILEELYEMGFCDEERNKELLKKNNGSIKRVVMDLIAGEKGEI